MKQGGGAEVRSKLEQLDFFMFFTGEAHFENVLSTLILHSKGYIYK